MNHDQQIRYSRHISLPQVGTAGQQALLAAKVLVVGAGGLGSPLLLYLAAAGVGTIGIVDADKVELSNLQRQVLHETGDIGRLKVESARDALLDINPGINVVCHGERLGAGNVDALIAGYDIVADGSDNFETRFLLSDRCMAGRKTLVSAAVQGFSGQLSVFKPYVGDPHPCYRCIYPDIPPAGTMPSCSGAGVLGAVAGMMGTWQAVEVVKELLGIGESLSGHLLVVEALKGEARKVRVKRRVGCGCGSSPITPAIP